MPDPTIQDELTRRKKQTIVIGLAFKIFLVTVVTLGFTVVVVNALISFSSRSVLIDCVEPEGECAKRGAESTGKVVQSLIDSNQLDEVATRQYVLFTIFCQERPGVDTIDEIQDCVDEQLAAVKAKKTP